MDRIMYVEFNPRIREFLRQWHNNRTEFVEWDKFACWLRGGDDDNSGRTE
jgi:hypothetical protein